MRKKHLELICLIWILQVLEFLIQNGADVNIVDSRRATPLHRAASKGDASVVYLLVSLGKDLNINATDTYGNTPLHLACENNSADVAEILIRHGANLNIKNKEEKIPLELASFEVQKILQKVIEEISN